MGFKFDKLRLQLIKTPLGSAERNIFLKNYCECNGDVSTIKILYTCPFGQLIKVPFLLPFMFDQFTIYQKYFRDKNMFKYFKNQNVHL